MVSQEWVLTAALHGFLMPELCVYYMKLSNFEKGLIAETIKQYS